MNNPKNERYIKLVFTGCAIALFTLLCYFLLSNLTAVRQALGVIGKILQPFMYGAVIAYLVTPLCRKLEGLFARWFKREGTRAGRVLAIVLSLLTLLLIVLAVLLLIVPQLVKSIQQLVKVLPGQIERARLALVKLMEAHPEWGEWLEGIGGDWYAEFNEFLKSGLPAVTRTLLAQLRLRTAALPSLTQSVITGAAGVAGVLANLMLGIIIAIYLLARRRQLAAQARLLLHGTLKPAWANWVEREVRLADRMFNGFFMGKLLDSAIVGVLCYIGCLLMGFGSPELIAVIVGVTNIIPFFGPYIGEIPCALLLLLESPMHCLMFLIFFTLLQQLDGNFIGPRILGNSTGLSGLWVMFAILLFGGLWGLGGMIVGVPLMAVLYDVIRQIAHHGLRHFGQEKMIDQYNREFHPEETKKIAKKKTR